MRDLFPRAVKTCAFDIPAVLFSGAVQKLRRDDVAVPAVHAVRAFKFEFDVYFHIVRRIVVYFEHRANGIAFIYAVCKY